MRTDTDDKGATAVKGPALGASRIWTDIDLEKEGKTFGYLRLNGDEFEGQVMLMKLMRTLDIENVRGQLIILSAANAPAAFAGRRTSPLDDRNLNREYPGDPRGSPTQEIAYFIDSVLLPRVDYLLDFHSGDMTSRFVPSAHVYHSPDKEKFERLLHMLKVFGMPTGVVLQGLIDHDKKAIGSCDRLGVLRFATELGGGGGITIGSLRAESGTVHSIRVHARTQIGDMLFMLHVPWVEKQGHGGQ